MQTEAWSRAKTFPQVNPVAAYASGWLHIAYFVLSPRFSRREVYWCIYEGRAPSQDTSHQYHLNTSTKGLGFGSGQQLRPKVSVFVRVKAQTPENEEAAGPALCLLSGRRKQRPDYPGLVSAGARLCLLHGSGMI